MNYELWLVLKVLELREMLNCDNSLFTTRELDKLFEIRDSNVKKTQDNKDNVIQLFQLKGK